MSDNSRSNVRLVLYIMGGCYLLYSAYGIWGNLSTTSGTQKILMFFFMVLFIASGIGMIVFSGIQMTKLGKETLNGYETAEDEEAEEELEIESAEETIEEDEVTE